MLLDDVCVCLPLVAGGIGVEEYIAERLEDRRRRLELASIDGGGGGTLDAAGEIELRELSLKLESSEQSHAALAAIGLYYAVSL